MMRLLTPWGVLKLWWKKWLRFVKFLDEVDEMHKRDGQ
jgi:hypothetical protein